MVFLYKNVEIFLKNLYNNNINKKERVHNEAK